MTKPADPTEPQVSAQFINSVKQNLISFASILEDIKKAAHYQVLGNCDVLEHGENNINGDSTKTSTKTMTPEELAKANEARIEFIIRNVDALIRNPVRLWIGRMNGLHRQMLELASRFPDK